RRIEDPTWVALLDDTSEAQPTDKTEHGANVLDRGHEREREERGPERLQTERRAGDRIRPDAARIVVSRAGDESRSDEQRELLQGLPLAFHPVGPGVAHVAGGRRV